MSEVTRILHRIEAGDDLASAELLPLVYQELRNLAARELDHEPSGLTLQPTELVHEAYLRLVDQEIEPTWHHRGHFYAAAAEAMRRILVEQARRRQTLKRGGDRNRVPLDEAKISVPSREPNLVALDEALSRLGESRPEIAQLVMLRYFGGLTMSQAALAMGFPLRTAERHWQYARAWLLEELADDRA